MKGLSVCIPVYNFNCIDSVKGLCEQLNKINLAAEILLMDDASSKNLDELSNFKNRFYNYEKLNQNVGRSRIRNLLVKKSKFDHILFLDGDSGIPENFIKNYLLSIEKYPKAIICGGRIHQYNFSRGSLRFNYGKKVEDTNALERIKNPYHSFATNNFVCTREIMEKIPFNEELTTYGHEDTFFGYELRKNNINIIHIDNAVIHLDLESNRNFIEMTKHSIENLLLLKSRHPEFVTYSKLLTTISKNRILRSKIIKNCAFVFSKLFECTAKNTGNVHSFQLFKLFYTISQIKKQ